MAVGVGASSDPLDYPGLAHFTEHMLFLGTQTYTHIHVHAHTCTYMYTHVECQFHTDIDAVCFVSHDCNTGTEKYPVENHYKQFLSKHGGSSNASTSMEATVYKFDVNHAHFEEALDIFRFGD